MQQDIWKFSLLIISAGIFGALADIALESMLFMCLFLLAWQIHRLNLLYKWIINSNKNPLPETSGQIYFLHRELNRSKASNRKRKKQLSRYLKQFRKAISALPDAIILINDDDHIEWANENAQRLLGVNWPLDSGIKLSNLIRDPIFVQHLTEGAQSDVGIEIASPINKNATINIKCIRYTGDLRMIIARDVSRLLQVNSMHKAFVANVSHELKTPLTVLQGYIETLQSFPDLDPRLERPIDQMASQSQRMAFLVTDLLYLSKLEDTSNQRHSENINVTHLTNEIIDSVQSLLKQKRHKIHLDLDHSMGLVGVRQELHSAFSNLIQNAINYTPEGGIIEIVWSKRQQASEPGATYTVKDNGAGIPLHHIPRLTERFYRVDENRSREKGGTGLGLAIVKHALGRHMATLDIQSTLGVGSEFSCRFDANAIIQIEQIQQQNISS